MCFFEYITFSWLLFLFYFSSCLPFFETYRISQCAIFYYFLIIIFCFITSSFIANHNYIIYFTTLGITHDPAGTTDSSKFCKKSSVDLENPSFLKSKFHQYFSILTYFRYTNVSSKAAAALIDDVAFKVIEKHNLENFFWKDYSHWKP